MNQLKQLYKESKFNIILFIPCISLTSVQLLSHIWHFVTPWTAADQASCPLLTLKFTQTHPLSQWCHPTISFSVVPFSSHLQYFQASGSLPISQFFASLAKVLEFQLQHHSLQINPKAALLQNGVAGSPCSPRDSQESSPTPQFKSINSLVLSFLYSATLTSIHDYWKKP